jgi:regulator of protease activity HflC (stomatin/prohibitin superfamily)
MSGFVIGVWTLLFLYTALKFVRSVRMVPNRSAYIVERLGRYHETLGPGFHMLIPFLDRVAYIQDLKEESIEVPPQDCFTKDNVKVEVDGILYLSVVSPENASYGVTDYRFAAIQLAQTTTRSVIGTLDLDRTFEEREAINSRVLAALGEVSEAWGIRVHRYEVKNIVPPPSVRDAMERQMGAERDRRALLASAEGQQRSKINDSEGRKLEMINRSQGEMQRRINEAEGRAAEVLALAQATAESIIKMGDALSRPGGVEAANLRLAQQVFGKLSNLAQSRTQVLLPIDLSAPTQLLDSLLLPSGGAPSSTRAIAAGPASSPGRPSVPTSPVAAPSSTRAAPGGGGAVGGESRSPASASALERSLARPAGEGSEVALAHDLGLAGVHDSAPRSGSQGLPVGTPRREG